MSINPTIYSRNNLPKYSYFLVRSDTKRLLSKLAIQEYTIYNFVNPVTEKRGIDSIKEDGVNEIVALSDIAYNTGTFEHFNYTNSKGGKLKLKYIDLTIIGIKPEDSRNEKITN